MPVDPDVDAFLKRIGEKPPSATKADSEPTPTKQDAPKQDEESWASYIGGGLKSGAKGVAEGLGGELESAAEFIPGYKDTSVAQWMREKTTADPDEEGSTANQIGRFVGESLPFMAIPEFGLGARLGTLAARAFPKNLAFNTLSAAQKASINAARKAAGQRALGGAAAVANPSQLGRFARAAARPVGRGAELAGIGAATGAIQDTEHPLEGAGVGALAGVTPIGLSALARSGLVSHMASHRARHYAAHGVQWATAGVLGQMMGLGHLGWAIYPAVAWGPVGSGIRHGVHYVVNSAGRVVGRVPDHMVKRAENFLAATGGNVAGSMLADQPTVGGSTPAAPQERPMVPWRPPENEDYQPPRTPQQEADQ